MTGKCVIVSVLSRHTHKTGRHHKHVSYTHKLKCSTYADDPIMNQGVHTETGFEQVWLNWFTKTGFEELHTFTLFTCNRFRLHVIAYSPVKYQDNGPVFSGVGEDNAITPC